MLSFQKFFNDSFHNIYRKNFLINLFAKIETMHYSDLNCTNADFARTFAWFQTFRSFWSEIHWFLFGSTVTYHARSASSIIESLAIMVLLDIHFKYLNINIMLRFSWAILNFLIIILLKTFFLINVQIIHVQMSKCPYYLRDSIINYLIIFSYLLFSQSFFQKGLGFFCEKNQP